MLIQSLKVKPWSAEHGGLKFEQAHKDTIIIGKINNTKRKTEMGYHLEIVLL